MTKSGRDADENFQSNWKHFDSLKFMQPSITSRQSVNNLVNEILNLYLLIRTVPLYQAILPGHFAIRHKIVCKFLTHQFRLHQNC